MFVVISDKYPKAKLEELGWEEDVFDAKEERSENVVMTDSRRRDNMEIVAGKIHPTVSMNCGKTMTLNG